MIFDRFCARADVSCPKLRGAGFLLGGLSAALLVLSLTGASLALSGVSAANEQGHYRLPRPALSLAAAPPEMGRLRIAS